MESSSKIYNDKINVNSMELSGKTFSRNGGTPFLRFPEPLSKSFNLEKEYCLVKIDGSYYSTL